VRNDRIMRALFLQFARNVLIDREDSWGNFRVRVHFADSVQLAGLAAGTRGWCSLGPLAQGRVHAAPTDA
jgi:hypothetical protein